MRNKDKNKKNNNKKRWFYDLTEKQVQEIMTIVMVIVLIVEIFYIYNNWPPKAFAEESESVVILYIAILLFFHIYGLGLLIYLILWLSPNKQLYLFKKEHDEKIVPTVREKFGLNSEFKEVLNNSDQIYHYFVKETEDGIIISKRDEDEKELESEIITNYNYLDLNYEPKNLDINLLK